MNCKFCVAVNGKPWRELAYAAAEVNGKPTGAADPAPSHLCNPREYFNARRDENHIYYISLKKEYVAREIEVFVLGYDNENLDLKPELWITVYPRPLEKIDLVLDRK